MTRFTQRDARSQNMVKSPGYCIKQIDFIFAVGLYFDNAQRTSKHVLTSSVRHQSTDARQNEIYLLNNIWRTSFLSEGHGMSLGLPVPGEV